MSTEAEKFAPTRRRTGQGASGPGLALAQSGEDDDTDYDYDDTPSGNIGQPPAANPGGRPVAPLPGREAAAGVRPAASVRLSSSLIARAWHPRPGRGSVRS